MDLQNFDTKLKSALEQIEVPYDANTWAALEKRLDALPAADALDQLLRPSLERIETGYDAGSWFDLANKMDTLTRVRRLRWSKAAEAAIFLLLLLNLKGFFGVVESVTKPAPAQNIPTEPIAKSHQGKKPRLQNAVSPVAQDQPVAASQSLADQVIAYVQNIAGNLSILPENTSDSPSEAVGAPIADNSSLLDPSKFYAQSGLVKFEEHDVLPANPVSPVLFASSQSPKLNCLQLAKTRKSSHFYAAAHASLDNNHLNNGTYLDKNPGYGGGVSAGYRKGKWGVEAGLQYSKKQYQPKPEEVVYQNDINGISFYNVNQVSADVVSVPVKVTRQIARFGKTSAHAVAGVTANYAAKKEYAIETKHYPPAPTQNPTQPPSPLPLGKGLFENGGMAHNAYATADLGIRVEQALGKRFVAYLEPAYRQSLGGSLGPVASRLNTFSLQAGVMASL